MIRFLPFILLLPTALFAQPQNPYTVPEYAPSKAVLVEWDFNNNTWDLYSELISHCREAAEVVCVVRDAGEEDDMTQRLMADGVPLSNVSFVHVPCERMWIRDHGPFAVQISNGVAFMDFNDKANSGLDENLPTNLAQEWNLDFYQIPWIFDGGNLLVDSYGTLFCTRGLYDNNPGMTPQSIAQDLENYMGINRIVTLKRQHNDYWAHIDMQAKLLDDSTFVVSSVSPNHPNYDSLEYNYQLIAGLETYDGKPYRIRRLPHADDWKTYANALILNNTVIVPVYDHPYDSLAISVYAELLPNHTLKTLNCNKIIGWEGALHCITMQLFDENAITAAPELPQSKMALSVIPNPAPAGSPVNLHLSGFNDPSAAVVVNIFDVTGRQVYVADHQLEDNRISIQATFTPGWYIAQVRSVFGVQNVPFQVF